MCIAKKNTIKIFLLIALISLMLFTSANTTPPFNNENTSTVIFATRGQVIGNTRSFGVAIADIDLDNDNDIFLSNLAGPSKLWLNNGFGVFSQSNQSFNSTISYGAHDVDMADLNGDSYPDVFIVYHGAPDKVYLNDGAGNFNDSGQDFGSVNAHPQTIQLIDADNDGDIDALIYNSDAPNRLWLNNGNGHFTMKDYDFGGSNCKGLELADFNGDSHPDLFISMRSQSSQIWINDGSCNFTNSGQTLGDESENSTCKDIDNDGDTDIVTGSFGAINIWLNQNNTGVFSKGFSTNEGAIKCCLFDADMDGDYDLLTTHIENGNKLWLNDGSGSFTSVGTIFGTTETLSIAYGKLDSDNDYDVLLGTMEGTGGNVIYFNESTQVGIDYKDNSETLTYKLYNNYPNPFNSETIIKYSLQNPAKISLKIYNLKGQKIITLVDKFQGTGEYQISWNANDLPSGLYFLWLQAGDFSKVKKLILQK